MLYAGQIQVYVQLRPVKMILTHFYDAADLVNRSGPELWKVLESRKFSLSATHNQKPLGETLRTSTSEMTVPVAFDFIVASLDDFVDLNIPETSIQGELNCGLHPDLGFAIGGSDMNVHSAFSPRKKEKPVLLATKDGRTHSFEYTVIAGFLKEA